MDQNTKIIEVLRMTVVALVAQAKRVILEAGVGAEQVELLDRVVTAEVVLWLLEQPEPPTFSAALLRSMGLELE